ncbi:MAG: hypothetical protein HOM01_00045, partial [Kordiimonadaceae bacterium]|nr:hypothetical protein [Kordiimonadaceae bacterium]
DGKMRVSVVATGIEADTMQKADIPQRQYTVNKQASSVVEEERHVTDEPIEQEPLDLVNEVEVATEELLDQLSQDITEVRQTLEDDENVEEDREAPFIAPEPVMPEEATLDKIKATDDVSDPYAEAALVNSEPREKPRQKLGLFQNLLGGKKEPVVLKEPVLKQGDMLNVKSSTPEFTAEPENKVENKKEVELKPLVSEGPVVKNVDNERDDDHLEIPAFLRRQAN